MGNGYFIYLYTENFDEPQIFLTFCFSKFLSLPPHERFFNSSILQNVYVATIATETIYISMEIEFLGFQRLTLLNNCLQHEIKRSFKVIHSKFKQKI